MEDKTQYISLKKAAKLCDYSQEYLSLRARQKKLKAIKIGRNWVTKKEWLEEYLKVFTDKKIRKVSAPRVIEPPKNLPIETSTIQFSVPVIKREPSLKMRLGIILVVVFILLFGGIFVARRTQPEVSLEDVTTTIMAMGSKEVQASTINTFKDYALWLRDNLENRFPELKSAYFAIDDFIKEKFVSGYRRVIRFPEEEPGPEPTQEGVIVVPYSEEEDIQKIKDSFSDEVRVEPKNRTSGIIIPIFRKKEGQKYLYLMVPTEE